MGLWMVTRVNGEDWVVLTAADNYYETIDGTVQAWFDSFCCRMVKNLGPRLAPNVAAIDAYVQTNDYKRLEIGSYVGIPIYDHDGGELFGTLCAIDPAPRNDDFLVHAPEVEMIGRLLSTVLASDLQADSMRRRAERAEFEANTDPMTGIGSRRGWDVVFAAEEERTRRLGDAAGVIVVDLDGLKRINDSRGHAAGDDLIKRAAGAISRSVRHEDFAARLGGDEFGVLTIGAPDEVTELIAARISEALRAADVDASVGWSSRLRNESLGETFELADAHMYTVKAVRRRGRATEARRSGAKAAVRLTGAIRTVDS